MSRITIVYQRLAKVFLIRSSKGVANVYRPDIAREASPQILDLDDIRTSSDGSNCRYSNAAL